MTDYTADHEGNVIVRNCGCGSHGEVSLWTQHGIQWRAQHRTEAIATLRASRDRFPGQSQWGRAIQQGLPMGQPPQKNEGPPY